MKRKNSPGCKCCGPPTCKDRGNQLAITVIGCDRITGVPGASVEMSNGMTTYSGSTNSSGLYFVTNPDPGTYTITWTYGALSATKTATITTACNSSTVTAYLVDGATPAFYVCCPGCLLPVLRDFYITDANGTLLFKKDPVNPFWVTDVVTAGDGSKYWYQTQCDGQFVQPNYTPFGMLIGIANLGPFPKCAYPLVFPSGTFPGGGPVSGGYVVGP